jgi:hypothetical protein
VTREDYKKSAKFKTAVRRLWVKILFVLLGASAVGGWFFGDLLSMARTPMVQSSLGQFMGISLVVYVAANLVLFFLVGRRP